MALATTLICLVMAYPLALLIARSPKKSRDLMVLLVILPFASNFLIRVYAWMIISRPAIGVDPVRSTACCTCSASRRCSCCSRRSRC